MDNLERAMSLEGQTIFHKIIRKEIPADIVFEDEQCLAFRDINPAAPVHILVIPKVKNIASLNELSAEDAELVGHLVLVAKKVAHEAGLAESGYRLVCNAGEGAGQSVFQLHFHVLGGRDFSWPPG